MLALLKRLLNHLTKPSEVERGIDEAIKRGVDFRRKLGDTEEKHQKQD